MLKRVSLGILVRDVGANITEVQYRPSTWSANTSFLRDGRTRLYWWKYHDNVVIRNRELIFFAGLRMSLNTLACGGVYM